MVGTVDDGNGRIGEMIGVHYLMHITEQPISLVSRWRGWRRRGCCACPIPLSCYRVAQAEEYPDRLQPL